MEIIIDGVKYLPANQVNANRESIIRGLMSYFWGEMGEDFDEKTYCSNVFVKISDSIFDEEIPTISDVADKIAEYEQERQRGLKHQPTPAGRN